MSSNDEFSRRVLIEEQEVFSEMSVPMMEAELYLHEGQAGIDLFTTMVILHTSIRVSIVNGIPTICIQRISKDGKPIGSVQNFIEYKLEDDSWALKT